MATTTDRRNYPNDYFAWYNDDDQLAIVSRVFTNDSTTDNSSSYDSYDTYSDSDVAKGIRINYHARYEKATNVEDDLKRDLGLDVGLHKCVVCYLKYRMLEDAGDIQNAQYYKAMFDNMVRKFPSRKSGVRLLSVPRL